MKQERLLQNFHQSQYFELDSNFLFEKLFVEMLPIDRYNLSDAFYHKISLNVLENPGISKLKRGIFLSWLITQVSYS